jgi:hypothetical protein
MIKHLRGLGRVAFGAILGAAALSASAAAQINPPPGAPQSSDATCVRLESQLATIDRGAADPARAEQVKRYEDAVAKQQADLDRLLAQSHKQGCEGGGFFALFTGQSPQCGPLNSQVQQMRANLDRTMSDLERLKSGNNSDQTSARREVIAQLAQADCGPQYRAAAAAAGPGGFLDALLGGKIINPGGDGAPAGTFHTVCVRTCDGYYFPISYSTVPSRFTDDQNTCQRLCPGSEAALYSYRNPGEDINQAVSASGQPYTALPNAFVYRRQFTAACSCRRPGQSWADALKNSDDASTLEQGDIVVTDQNAKALAQPPQPKGSKTKSGAKTADPKTPDPKTPDPNAPAAGAAAATDASAPDTDPAKRSVRTVGPPFVSAH